MSTEASVVPRTYTMRGQFVVLCLGLENLMSQLVTSIPGRVLLAVLLAALPLRATDKPVATSSKDTPPAPISIAASPIHFMADGQEHGPTLTVKPIGATYTITGTATAKEPGTYSFTVTATEHFVGAMTCKWRIDAAPPTAPATHSPNVTIRVDLLTNDLVVATGTATFDNRQLTLVSPDHKYTAHAALSRNIARDAAGHPLAVKGSPAWRCYGTLFPTGAHGTGCVLQDHTSGNSARASLNGPNGTYTLILTALSN
jgi:hypothetical protein